MPKKQLNHLGIFKKYQLMTGTHKQTQAYSMHYSTLAQHHTGKN